MRVIRSAGVEGSVLGAGSPSGPRASSAVWLRLRSGGLGLLVRSMEGLDSATAGAVWTVCGWTVVASGVAPVVVGRLAISTALLV